MTDDEHVLLARDRGDVLEERAVDVGVELGELVARQGGHAVEARAPDLDAAWIRRAPARNGGVGVDPLAACAAGREFEARVGEQRHRLRAVQGLTTRADRDQQRDARRVHAAVHHAVAVGVEVAVTALDHVRHAVAVGVEVELVFGAVAVGVGVLALGVVRDAVVVVVEVEQVGHEVAVKVGPAAFRLAGFVAAVAVRLVVVVALLAVGPVDRAVAADLGAGARAGAQARPAGLDGAERAAAVTGGEVAVVALFLGVRQRVSARLDDRVDEAARLTVPGGDGVAHVGWRDVHVFHVAAPPSRGLRAAVAPRRPPHPADREDDGVRASGATCRGARGGTVPPGPPRPSPPQ